MKNELGHRGLGLAELLGTLVIFGMALSLGVMLVASLVRSSDRILNADRATSLGNQIVERLENAMDEAAGDAYSSCPGNQDCIILNNTFDYELNDTLGEVVLTVHNPIIQTRVELDNGQILIDSIPIDLGDFTLDSSSGLAFQTSGTEVRVTITFSLIAPDGRPFAFTASHRFSLADIPTP